MIRSLLTINVSPETGELVIERYTALEVLERAVLHAGALSCEIVQSVNDAGSLLILALWDDEDAYTAWLTHPIREQIGEGMADLPFTPLSTLYEVKAQVTASAAGATGAASS